MSPATLLDTISQQAVLVVSKNMYSLFRYANVFLHPVKEEIAPGYHSIVHR